MLTFSFSSSFIFKALSLLSRWLRALWMRRRDLIAGIPLNLRLQNTVSLSQECQLSLSVITQSCHRRALCSMQMIVAGPRISVGKGCEKSVLQCLYKTEDWSIAWQEHPHVEIRKQQTLWHSKRAQCTWKAISAWFAVPFISTHYFFLFLTAC